jgi:hypothetical protein
MHLLRTISGVDAVLGISRLASFALLAMHDRTKRFVRVLEVASAVSAGVSVEIHNLQRD